MVHLNDIKVGDVFTLLELPNFYYPDNGSECPLHNVYPTNIEIIEVIRDQYINYKYVDLDISKHKGLTYSINIDRRHESIIKREDVLILDHIVKNYIIDNIDKYINHKI